MSRSNKMVSQTVSALAVMTKAPLAGASKTRLTPPLTANEAAKLSACFLRDTCDNIAAVCRDGTSEGIAVYTPAVAEAWVADRSATATSRPTIAATRPRASSFAQAYSPTNLPLRSTVMRSQIS